MTHPFLEKAGVFGACLSLFEDNTESLAKYYEALHHEHLEKHRGLSPEMQDVFDALADYRRRLSIEPPAPPRKVLGQRLYTFDTQNGKVAEALGDPKSLIPMVREPSSVNLDIYPVPANRDCQLLFLSQAQLIQLRLLLERDLIPSWDDEDQPSEYTAASEEAEENPEAYFKDFDLGKFLEQAFSEAFLRGVLRAKDTFDDISPKNVIMGVVASAPSLRASSAPNGHFQKVVQLDLESVPPGLGADRDLLGVLFF